MTKPRPEGSLKSLVRVLQCFLAIAFVVSLYHTLVSAAFWIALLKAQASPEQELIDYVAAFAGPVLQLLHNVEYIAVATILELMLRIQELMLIRRPMR
ncbi:MAG TPA: hypothetical protein VEH07_09015 [Alphaproteobacteria bacterium]|nr:hypothetical protein [Alphaproteobacteria bacterium]